MTTSLTQSRSNLYAHNMPPILLQKRPMEFGPEQSKRMKDAFNNKMGEIIKGKHCNTQIFTQTSYMDMISKVEHAKSLKFGKTPADYGRLKKYDILEINGVKRLVVPFGSSTSSDNKSSDSIRMFVYVEETFDLLHTAHLNSGHRGRMGMAQELIQFKNITREMICVYLSVCEVCNKKEAAKIQEKDPKISYIDLIKMPEDQVGYNFILVHIDFKTQFVQLRTLKNMDAGDVARALLDIFTIFGPSRVIRGNIAKEFEQKIATELIVYWSELEITFMNTKGLIDVLEVSKVKITELLSEWMASNESLPWSEGVKFVQYMKNKEYNKALARSSAEAMFGNRLGRTIQGKRTSKVINQSTSDVTKEDKPDETSLVINESQRLEDQAGGTAKRIKTEEILSSSEMIEVIKVETDENESCESWEA